MNALKYVIVAVIVLISAVASFLIYRDMQEDTSVDEEVTETVEEEDAVLKIDAYFSDVLGNVEVGDEFEVDVLVNTQLYEVPAADFVFDYDADALEVVSVELGDFDDFLRNTVDAENERIYVSVISNPTSPFTGIGRVAKLTLKAKKTGATTVSFYDGDEGQATYLSAVGGAALPTAYEDLELTVK